MLGISICHHSICWALFILNDGGHLGCTLIIQIASEHGGLLRFILADVRFFRDSFKLVILVQKLDIDLLDRSILNISRLILILNLVGISNRSLQKIVRILQKLVYFVRVQAAGAYSDVSAVKHALTNDF